MTVMECVTSVEAYELGMKEHRDMWEQSDTVSRLLNSNATQEFVYLTYIQYCSVGTRLTKPVESWIYRAGERCIETGMVDLGNMLKKHSVHEKNHDRMMVKDTHGLVDSWNNKHPRKVLDANLLLSQPETNIAKAYTALHEDAINSDSPFAQLAIEYEIERLSVVLGPRLLEHAKSCCGPDFIELLSFLDDHVRIDVVHTELNYKQLDTFLNEHPGTLDVLIETGKKALDTYMGFFEECLVSAEKRHLEIFG